MVQRHEATSPMPLRERESPRFDGYETAPGQLSRQAISNSTRDGSPSTGDVCLDVSVKSLTTVGEQQSGEATHLTGRSGDNPQ